MSTVCQPEPDGPPAYQEPEPVNLSGVWLADDSGTYLFEHEGDWLHFEGYSQDGGASWSNVFDGRVVGNTIEGIYFDRPPGRCRNSTPLKLQIVSGSHLQKSHDVYTPFRGANWNIIHRFAAPDSKEAPPAVPNLSGKWMCTDGGSYEVSHGGSRVAWRASASDGSWAHSFSGVLRGDVIVGHFADHRPGKSRDFGPLFIRVVDGSRFETLPGTYGGAVWTR